MPMTTEQLLQERRQREQAERVQLDRLRLETGAVEVRLHHVPVWFAKRCRQWLREHGLRRSPHGNWYVVQDFARHIANMVDVPLGWWLDHHGSAEKGTVFVNEPYANEYHHAAARKAAEELGLELTITDRSWWYPGHTTRFEFRLPEGQEVKLPAQLEPSSIVAIVDSREQHPLDLSPLRTITAGLQTGDYSLASLEAQVAIERKSLTDLVSCCGAERERFSREIMRLQAYRCRALVVESSWSEIEAGGWRSKVSPQTVIGSLLSWQAEGLPIMLCGDHSRAGRMVSRLLYTYARHRWRELRELAEKLETDASMCPTEPDLPGVHS